MHVCHLTGKDHVGDRKSRQIGWLSRGSAVARILVGRCPRTSRWWGSVAGIDLSCYASIWWLRRMMTNMMVMIRWYIDSCLQHGNSE